VGCLGPAPVCTENPIRIDCLTESPALSTVRVVEDERTTHRQNVAFDNLCVMENELQAAMTNPLLCGLVDFFRPSVHGLAFSLRLVAP